MKTIVYLVMGAVWLLSKILKNNKKKDIDSQSTEYEDVEQSFERREDIKPVVEEQYDQPQGFQDLFDQILSEKKEIPKPIPKPIEYKTVEPKPITAKVEEDEFERFDSFSLKTEEQNEYAELFENQDSIKKAFIASEVFARKY